MMRRAIHLLHTHCTAPRALRGASPAVLLIASMLLPQGPGLRLAFAEDAKPAAASDEDDPEVEAAQILDDRAIPVKRVRKKRDPYRKSRETRDEGEM